MIFLGDGKLKLELGEPYIVECWKCNKANTNVKNIGNLRFCCLCCRFWIYGKYIDELTSNKKFDTFFKSFGIKDGYSTITKEPADVTEYKHKKLVESLTALCTCGGYGSCKICKILERYK